jgi:hypothetical protein
MNEANIKKCFENLKFDHSFKGKINYTLNKYQTAILTLFCKKY